MSDKTSSSAEIYRAPTLAAFMKAMAHVNGCWPWPKYRKKDGYGLTTVNQKTTAAHRAAFRLANGFLPSDQLVCHECDNPPCCNPRHLFLGTQKDNTADAIAKGRFVTGTRNGIAKLTELDIIAIRADTRTQMELAAAFGVSQTLISNIKLRKVWRHVAT